MEPMGKPQTPTEKHARGARNKKNRKEPRARALPGHASSPARRFWGARGFRVQGLGFGVWGLGFGVWQGVRRRIRG